MEKEYIVSIHNKQTINGRVEDIELLLPCEYKVTNGTTYIKYNEYDKDNPSLKTESNIEISNNTAILTKSSNQQSKLILEKGTRKVGHYGTIYGELFIGVFTHDIKYKLNESGGQIKLVYSLDVNTQHLSKNEVLINIKEVK